MKFDPYEIVRFLAGVERHMGQECDACRKGLRDGDSVLLLIAASFAEGMTEKPEFGWSAHYRPLKAWCDQCGARVWSKVHGECAFCEAALSVGDPVFCLVSGDIPRPASRSLERRESRFVAHRQCFQARYPEYSS